MRSCHNLMAAIVKGRNLSSAVHHRTPASLQTTPVLCLTHLLRLAATTAKQDNAKAQCQSLQTTTTPTPPHFRYLPASARLGGCFQASPLLLGRPPKKPLKGTKKSKPIAQKKPKKMAPASKKTVAKKKPSKKVAAKKKPQQTIRIGQLKEAALKAKQITSKDSKSPDQPETTRKAESQTSSNNDGSSAVDVTQVSPTSSSQKTDCPESSSKALKKTDSSIESGLKSIEKPVKLMQPSPAAPAVPPASQPDKVTATNFVKVMPNTGSMEVELVKAMDEAFDNCEVTKEKEVPKE